MRENLMEQQRSDPELSRIVQLRLTFSERPTNKEIEGESELTKKLCYNWDALKCMMIFCTENSSVREVENRTCYSYWCQNAR